MAEQQIRFDDGAAYERMMGRWSRLAGDVFLDWLAPRPGLDWIDIGCGNGAFTEAIVKRAAPRNVVGVEPSEGQLKYARTRPGVESARFMQGDAMALPVADRSADVAVMALVIFFVPEPARGVAEMARVLRPGGMAAAYAWDLDGGGFPLEPMQAEMRAVGLPTIRPPSAEASRIDVLRALWSAAGFSAIETREIVATRTFDDFEDVWTTSLLSNVFQATVSQMAAADLEALKGRVRARLPASADGRITYSGRANAIKGCAPG